MRGWFLHAAMWMASRLAADGTREALLGDLAEEQALRANQASSAAALRWCLRQALASAPPLLWVRLTRTAWLSTLAVALLAYVAVGVVQLAVKWAMAVSAAPGSVYAYSLLGMCVTFPMVVLIAYVAARFRRSAAVVLGALMLTAITLMTLLAHEHLPVWLRIAYFVVGPAAALIGSALRSPRLTRS